MRLRDRIRIWFKKQKDTQWQWGHPDEWSEDEWLDYDYRKKHKGDKK